MAKSTSQGYTARPVKPNAAITTTSLRPAKVKPFGAQALPMKQRGVKPNMANSPRGTGRRGR